MISIKSIKKLPSSIIFLHFLLLPAVGNAIPPTDIAAKLPFWQYSAKFVCGTQKDDTDVVSGTYRTTINIHNTSPKKSIEFRKKAVVAFAERNKHGANGTPQGGSVLISLYHLEFLLPDDAMGVDCKDIFGLLKSPNSLSTESLPIPIDDADTFFKEHQIEGFLVIQVLGSANNEPLDVIGKYSARSSGSEVSTLDVEQVPGKRVTQ